MDDEVFIHEFESCKLPAVRFHHREHIRITWLYLHRHGAIEALVKVSDGIKRFAASVGKPDRYHETITWAYVFLVRERIEHGPPSQSWEEFCLANADLLDWKDSVLKKYYREETLASPIAKRAFVFPDRIL